MCEQFRDRFEQVPCHEPFGASGPAGSGPVEFREIVTPLAPTASRLWKGAGNRANLARRPG